VSMKSFEDLMVAGHSDRVAKIAKLTAQVAAEAPGKASLRHLILDMAQRRHARITVALEHVAKVGIGANLKSRTCEQFALLLPDASVAGSFRYQLYDERGFFGHSTHPTLYAAALDAAEQGYCVPDVSRGGEHLMTLRSFERGNRVAGLIQRLNAGLITMAAANDEVAAMDAEYAAIAAA